MKQMLAMVPLAVLVACSSTKPAPSAVTTNSVTTTQTMPTEPIMPTEPYERRVAEVQVNREAQVNRSISQAPDWMNKLPESKSAVFANGSAVSTDMSMADYKAKLFAYGKICMAAGGKVNQSSQIFMQDSTAASTEISELAIKSMCPNVDITGVEIRDVKRIGEGNRFRTYVLVALPTGEANAIQRRKDQIKLNNRAEQRSRELFKEMDANAEKDATVEKDPQSATPSVQLFPDPTAQQ
jgi:hypothetical protein